MPTHRARSAMRPRHVVQMLAVLQDRPRRRRSRIMKSWPSRARATVTANSARSSARGENGVTLVASTLR